MLFYYTEVACVAGGIVVPSVLSWRQNRHAKQQANPIFKRLRPRLFTVPYFSLEVVGIDRFALRATFLDAKSVKST